MRASGIVVILLFISITAAGLCLPLDFNGKYTVLPTITDPWCGRSIEIRKIRFNKYRISWELLSGEKSVVELVGKLDGDMIDFRKGKGAELYGYTYALAENKNKLIVTLKVPNREVVCGFIREKSE